MKEVCSCGAKFDTLDELYQHINAEMGTDYSPDEFTIPEGAEGLQSKSKGCQHSFRDHIMAIQWQKIKGFCLCWR